MYNLKNIINPLNLTPIISNIHKLFSTTYGTFYKIDNMLSNEISINKFKWT